jgi:hypothetical protein
MLVLQKNDPSIGYGEKRKIFAESWRKLLKILILENFYASTPDFPSFRIVVERVVRL